MERKHSSLYTYADSPHRFSFSFLFEGSFFTIASLHSIERVVCTLFLSNGRILVEASAQHLICVDLIICLLH